MEDGLREHKGTFETIFDACEEGIITVDENGNIVLANPAAHTMFGYDPGELISQHVETLVPPALRHRHKKDRNHYGHDPSPRRMGAGRELLGHKKDGTLFPVEISLNRAQINNVYHTVAFIIDITERKKIEEALKLSEEQLILYASELEKRVSQRTEELDKTINELEKANKELAEQVKVRQQAEEEAKKALQRERELNELKSRFVSMASHEFRTPLSTILSSASLIGKYNSEGTEEKRIRHVGKIKSSINNLNNILNDFLSLAKLEEGKINLNRQPIDLEVLLEDIVDELSSLAKEGQQINLALQGKPRLIRTDENLLKNICINLISNATKYSDPHKPIEVTARFHDRHLTITIRDYGIGIPEEDQKHMFERFFRAKNATNIQGTGLGLNIVKKYVEMLDGNVSFSSKLNEGSIFTVKLPVT